MTFVCIFMWKWRGLFGFDFISFYLVNTAQFVIITRHSYSDSAWNSIFREFMNSIPICLLEFHSKICQHLIHHLTCYRQWPRITDCNGST